MKSDDLSAKTKKELLEMARKLQIAGRSTMSKDQLAGAIRRSGPKQPQRPRPAREKTERPKSARPRIEPARSDRDRRRERAKPPRREAPEIDPAMKLSRVEEVRSSSPGRRSRGRAHAKRRGDGRVHPERGRGDRSQDRQDPRRSAPPKGRASRGRDRDRDRDRDRRSDRRSDRHSDRRRERFGDRRDRGDSRGRPRDVTLDERALQAREHLRRTGEARRESVYTPQFQNRKRGRRTESSRRPSNPERGGRREASPAPRAERAHRPSVSAVESLPEKYGVDRLALMVRDPYWLHAYWEVTPRSLRRARESLGEGWDGHRWILRVHVYPGGEPRASADHFDVALNPDARNWYLRVPHPSSAYEGSIGLLARDGTYYPLARSERVRTPGTEVEETADLHWDLHAETEVAAPATDRIGRELPSSESVLGFGASETLQSGEAPSSGDVTRPPGEGDVRFTAEAELILYGSTEPDARLTIQGKPVALRRDGTFTVRFQLPDGLQRIPCSATSADGRVRRTIDLVVERRTDFRTEGPEDAGR
ncbi:MAG: DUF4912 domain-containing protein [Candidatus Eisenbacteria bacterium]|nr:DUF4912 domain-containing protein [Candidatus Latescibacterota bacterium]MBD3302178.1 DUF4912 domain-containing protein [Candidatus Eisenbacteria bacterium]